MITRQATVYVTKAALTSRGIVGHAGVIEDGADMCGPRFRPDSNRFVTFPASTWIENYEEALVAAERMRVKEIARLQRQVMKLENDTRYNR
jgi:hypothetical protein